MYTNQDKKYDIICFAPLMVDIIRKEINVPLDSTGDFIGPFPGGDSVIMIDAATRLGAKTAFYGVVGDDDFGKCVTERLANDGVDVSGIRKVSDMATGVGFVTYFEDGSRKFIFTVPDSAAGMLNIDDVDEEAVNNTKWLHISGFSLCVSKSMREAIMHILDIAPPDLKICFDPNLRPEVFGDPEIKVLCDKMIERCDVFFPSEGEAAFFSGKESDEQGCKYFAAKGTLVASKRGKSGCVIYNGDARIVVPTIQVEEIDPTGAGDVFCGAFITALIEGMELAEAGRFANYAGALSVTKRGPMERIITRAEAEGYKFGYSENNKCKGGASSSMRGKRPILS